MVKLPLGAIPRKGRVFPKGKGFFPNAGGTDFLVWAPLSREVFLKIVHPLELTVPMERKGRGYFGAFVPGIGAGARYLYLLEGGKERPDPASRFQPGGVHGPSEIVDPGSYKWRDKDWKNIPFQEYIIYELHIGTFTPEGTFAAAIGRLPYLKELGITAVEIMPVAQFPGSRNWGYDGVYPYAAQNSYDGPEGLKRLVDACHAQGLAVILDVVYNHLGPEGNYLADFGPCFTGRYRTPWGDAINYDGPYSDDVRGFFIGNALYWLREFHFDALRLDAVHGIHDESPKHFAEELKEEVLALSAQMGKPLYVFAESDRNDARLIRPFALGGCGIDAHWNDDFHHALHVLLTGERHGYYMDFSTGPEDLLKSFREGFVYTGQYSEYRKKSHGSPSADRPPEQFVVFTQNHDQVGNRLYGDRPSGRLGPEKLKLAAAALFAGPFIPLLFMGEEYGEKAPFMYFVSHSDPALVEAVREGRKKEFSAFRWEGEVPDAQSEGTFKSSKLNPDLRLEPIHSGIFDFYRKLIALRKEIPALRTLTRDGMVVSLQKKVIIVIRSHDRGQVLIALNFSGEQSDAVLPYGKWAPLAGSLDLFEIVENKKNNNILKLAPHEAVLLRKTG